MDFDIDMDFMKAIPILTTTIFTRRMIDGFMGIAPLGQTIVNVVLIRINERI